MPSQRLSNRQWQRVWAYHSDADALLHSRTQTLAICQAFLVAGYATLLSSEKFFTSPEKWTFACGIAIAAILLSLAMLRTNSAIADGIEALKKHEKFGLELDDAYRDYIKSIRNDARSGYNGTRIIGLWIPCGYVLGWLITVLHLGYWVFIRHIDQVSLLKQSLCCQTGTQEVLLT